MKTSDVRIDPKLNQFIWNQGVRNLPRRVRVRISRKRTEDEGKGSEWYSLVQHINTEDFSNKLTEKAKVSAWFSYLNINHNLSAYDIIAFKLLAWQHVLMDNELVLSRVNINMNMQINKGDQILDFITGHSQQSDIDLFSKL